MNTLIGKVAFISAKEQLTESFAKILVGITVEGNYQSQVIPFEFVNDKMKIVDTIKINDEVRLHYSLNGSKWTNKAGKTNYSASLRGQRIDILTIPTPGDAFTNLTNDLKDQTSSSETQKSPIADLYNNM